MRSDESNIWTQPLKCGSCKIKSSSRESKSTSDEIKSTSWSNTITSWIVNRRVKRKNYEFKDIEFNDFIVSNETILPTKQQFFLKRTKHNWLIVLLGFSLILLPGTFISYYTIIYFFVKNIFFRMFIFQWIQYSNILICLLVEK